MIPGVSLANSGSRKIVPDARSVISDSSFAIGGVSLVIPDSSFAIVRISYVIPELSFAVAGARKMVLSLS